MVASYLDEIDAQQGYNLYEAYKFFDRNRKLLITTDDKNGVESGDYASKIRSLVIGMIKDDSERVRRNITEMKHTPNGISKKIRELWERDKQKFYEVTYVIPPWTEELTDSSLYKKPKYQDGEDVAKDMFEKVPDFIQKTDTVQEIKQRIEDRYDPIVETTKEDYTGVTVKFIGTSHNCVFMTNTIKEELEDCDLIMVESGTDDEFVPKEMIGHRAADGRNALSIDDDIVRVLEGHPGYVESPYSPELSRLEDLIFTGGSTHNLAERQKHNEILSSQFSEWYNEVVEKRDHKFVLQAIEHIVESHYKEGVEKVAIIAGKAHIPGMYQYFDNIDFGEDKRTETTEQNTKDKEESMLGW